MSSTVTNFISTILPFAPLQLGVFGFANYIGFLMKNKNMRITSTLISIIISLFFIGVYAYIIYDFNSRDFSCTDSDYYHYYYVKFASILITVTLFMVVFILKFFVIDSELYKLKRTHKNDNCKSIIDQAENNISKLENLDLLLGTLFATYLFHRLYKSVKKMRNGIYVDSIDYEHVYKSLGFAILSLTLKFVKLHSLNNLP